MGFRDVPRLSSSQNDKLTQIDLPGLRLWFSYETLVAFAADYQTPTVRENAWGPTTGRHLASIDGGARRTKERLGGAAFDAAFDAVWEPRARALSGVSR